MFCFSIYKSILPGIFCGDNQFCLYTSALDVTFIGPVHFRLHEITVLTGMLLHAKKTWITFQFCTELPMSPLELNWIQRCFLLFK